MVQEKVDAAVEGALAAQAAWRLVLHQVRIRRRAHAPRRLGGLTNIAEAAAGPARRKVRANARRLTGAKTFP